MDAITPKEHRNSRWDREPVLDENGKPKIAKITSRDLNIIFPKLAAYRYLSTDFLHAFTGGDYVSLRRHLNLLSRKPNLYINRPKQQREHAEANYRRLMYELDTRGAQTLSQRGIEIPKSRSHGHFAHTVFECQIAASIELGVLATPDMVRITWPALLASSDMPERTRKATNPFRIHYTDKDSVEPDGEPFVIGAGDRYMFFPGFEADCDTESLESALYSTNTIESKFKGYLHIIDQRIYRTHFGANTFMVPFVTTNVTRMKSMMHLLWKLIEQNGYPKHYARHFAFKYAPPFDAHRETFRPTGHMLTEPWERVGNPPLILTQL